MTIEISGEGNEIDIDPALIDSKLTRIVVKGSGNKIKIGKCAAFGGVYLEVKNGGMIEIGEGCILSAIRIFSLAPGASIRIGRSSGFNGSSQITAHEPSTISIGSGCLIASGVCIASSDVHKIFDIETGVRTNPPADVTIGDKVWIADSATIMKGSRIGSGSIVGRDSQVRGEFPPNSLIAGIPATIRRTGVRWEH